MLPYYFSPEARERLATHTYDLDVIAALLVDRTVRVRKGVARNLRTIAEQRSVLAQGPVVDVRVVLVRAVELAEADLERLVDDRSVQVRLAMATSEVVPPHIRWALGADSDDMVDSAAREFRPASGSSSVVRAPRVGHRRSGTGPGRSGGAAR